ncbi:Hsp20/alpha crystallin family protein [Zongyangia hominis]|uniref:Hsp20/alpha crystallin family protein n=1 Tax=Zongyangia hominis TaxID=2763677 RepID=A0A926EDS0_9FIRM|nr:Hsp20/alpha crystallin family protein [Zongyangia hominis]MBC8570056.1 Hsp20/alpha crystallin family protein [Zongyangia hominis]
MFDLLPFERRRNDLMHYFNDWGKDFFGEMGDQISAFRTDIRDKGDHYLLEAELPGFDKKDIGINLEGDTLTISAKHETQNEEKKDNYIRRERSYGSFVRSFDVSGIDTGSIKAEYKNGVLELILPKVVETKPQSRQIDIG